MNSHLSQSHLIACHECDQLLYFVPSTDARQTAHCPRCDHAIQAGVSNSLDQVVALCITALIVLVIANYFNFLGFDAKGQERSINLLNASYELYLQGYPVLSVLIFTFIVAIPFLYMSCLLLICLPVKLGIRWRPSLWVGRLCSAMLPWAMSEVFLVGVLVALIKMASLATIIFGVSFWAYILFSILFLRVEHIVDSHRLWGWIDDQSHFSV